MFKVKKHDGKHEHKPSYQLTYIIFGERKDFDFEDQDEAVLCFYGKIAEMTFKYPDLKQAPEVLMSLFAPSKDILINYHLEKGKEELVDLRK